LQAKTKRQRKASCKYRLDKFEKYQVVSRLAVVIKQHFPLLFEQFAALADNRTRPRYSVKELIVSGVLIFLFK
jgi:hypothetical protein